MKKQATLSDRLDLSMISTGIAVMAEVLVNEVDKTDWNQFIQTHRGSITALSIKFSEFYTDNERNLTMVAHYFGEQLGATLKELEELVAHRRGSPTSAVRIARLQAKILIWKQQLEQVWSDIKSEQEIDSQQS